MSAPLHSVRAGRSVGLFLDSIGETYRDVHRQVRREGTKIVDAQPQRGLLYLTEEDGLTHCGHKPNCICPHWLMGMPQSAGKTGNPMKPSRTLFSSQSVLVPPLLNAIKLTR